MLRRNKKNHESSSVEHNTPERTRPATAEQLQQLDGLCDEVAFLARGKRYGEMSTYSLKEDGATTRITLGKGRELTPVVELTPIDGVWRIWSYTTLLAGAAGGRLKRVEVEETIVGTGARRWLVVDTVADGTAGGPAIETEKLPPLTTETCEAYARSLVDVLEAGGAISERMVAVRGTGQVYYPQPLPPVRDRL